MKEGRESADEVNADTSLLDDVVSPWLERFSNFLDKGVPSAYRIWRLGRSHLERGDARASAKCEQLNYFLHNSSIPSSVDIGKGVNFGYGGIGVVIHSNCEIEDGVVIGSNVTLGGKSNSKARSSSGGGGRIYVPHIGEYAYLATGCKILGGVKVGAFSIVGANAVVTADVPPLSIVAGAPAKIVKQIDLENCLAYRPKSLPIEEYVARVKKIRENS